MRSLQQKISKPVQFSFINLENTTFNYSLSPPFRGATTNYSTYRSSTGGKQVTVGRYVNTTLVDAYGKGVLMGVITPQLSPSSSPASNGITVSSGGDYTLTVEVDGKIYNLSNPSTADYGGSYTLNRGTHWFNCPWLYSDSNRVGNIDGCMAGGYGLPFKSHLKITLNCPATYDVGRSDYKYAAAVYELFSAVPWGYMNEVNI